jgi:hypothetical protein
VIPGGGPHDPILTPLWPPTLSDTLALRQVWRFRTVPSPATAKDISMATFAFVMPVVPGKEGIVAETLRRMGTPGPKHDAYAAARRSQGLTREAVWQQKTPMGTFAIVLLQGDDIAASFAKIASSDDPFAVQFRDFVKDVHNVDLAKDPPPDVELLLDARFR